MQAQQANNHLLLDEVPVGQSNFNLPEYPTQETPTQPTPTSIPQKLKSKAIKVKLQGLDEVIKILSEGSASEQLNEICICKLLKQNNPACLEKALLLTKQWIKNGRSWNQEEIKVTIENGFINGKNQHKKVSIQVCEIMYDNKPDQCERTILNGFKSKTPKLIGGYLAMLNEMLTIFGSQKLKYLKPYYGEVVRVMNGEKLPIVKNEGTNLLKSAYKLIGKQVVDALTTNLKENIKKQLDSFWQNQNQTDSIPQVNTSSTFPPSKPKIDAYDLSQPVELFKQFDEKWTDSVLNAEKWSVKIELMQQLIKKASVPKIANSEHRHIVEMIRRLVNDSNFNVVLTVLKVAGVISKGLRKNFTNSAKILFPLILSKMKDKKNQMIQETFHTLNDFYFSLSIEDVTEDIKQGLKDKAPNMRVNIINWVGKFIEKKIQDKGELPEKTKNALKSMFNIFDQLLSDGTSQVRDSMGRTLGRLKTLIGEQFFQQLQKTLNKKIDVDEKGRISKSKDKRDKSAKKLPNLDDLETSKGSYMRNPQVPVDISDEISRSLRKLNDGCSWQNRKQSAQSLIKLIQRYDGKVVIKNFSELSTTLKSRINDPNKQLIRIFVNLIRLIFPILNQKQIKLYSRPFVCSLVEGLSDKMQVNRKEIILTIQKIGQLISQESILAIMAHYLHGQNQLKLQVLNYIFKYQTQIEKVDIKEFPKGIISCLCDKNREIRSMAETLFPLVLERTGIEIFRHLVKDQKPIYQNELSSFLDTHDTKESKKFATDYYSSVKASPSAVKSKKNRKQSNASLSRTKISLDKDNQKTTTNISFTAKSYIEGDENFASLKILTQQRTEREEREERYCYISATNNEEQLKYNIKNLFNHELYQKMFSNDYKKNLDVGNKLIKICKDISQQTNIRQLYDLLLGWIALKLYGGNPALSLLTELVTPILSILQKKKIAITDRYLDIIFTIIREYVVSVHWTESISMELLANIIKCSIALSSGFRTLKKVLQELRLELSTQHRHVKKECTQYYRNILVQLVCDNLNDSISNDEILEQAAKVKELAENKNFISLLKNKFHHSILEEFGFCDKKTHNPNYNSNGKGISVNTSVPEKVFYNEKSQSKIKAKPKTPTKTKIEEIPIYNLEVQDSSASLTSNNKTNQQCFGESDYFIDLSCYMFPNPYSVLSDNLNKLKNPNQKIAHNASTFFSTLFLENGKKIADQLKQYSGVIFASILNALITTVKYRHEYHPDKIISSAVLVQESIKCKHVFKNIGNVLLLKTFKFTIDQLVYEDEFRQPIESELRSRGIQFKPDGFIKAINGIMLRILQNSIPQQSVNILLKILTQNLSKMSPKKLGLLVKCVGRVANNYEGKNIENHGYAGDFIAESVNYLREIKLKSLINNQQLLNKSEETIVGTIKTILKSLCQEMKSQIWKQYNEVRHKFEEDMGISEYLNQFVQQNQTHSTYSSLQPSYKTLTSTQTDEELRMINELLSKSKTFKEGIKKLKDYITKNRSFNVGKYFKQMNYEARFIELVQQQLEKEGTQKFEGKDNLSANINEKLKQLKMRFDGMQKDKSHGQNLTPKNKRDISRSIKNNKSTVISNQQEEGTDVKKRIDDMKRRVNFASTNRIR